MRGRVLMTAALAATMTAALAAGNAHFVGVPHIAVNGDSVIVSGKVAGLGNVPQIDVTVSADANCVNRGNKQPSADNKQSFDTAGSFPTQNGKALFVLELEATFTPDCAPPMRVEWSNVQIVVTAEDGTLLTYP